MAKKSKVWNSQEVAINIERMRMGQDFDNSAFYSNDPDLKAEMLNFQLSNEEFTEYVKCSQDCVYFVQKYCNFLTDKGRMAVKLRDYQKKILNILTAETYDESMDEWLPNERNVALCQSRQSGKCVTPNTELELGNNKKVKISELFVNSKKNILFYIKFILYKIYNSL